MFVADIIWLLQIIPWLFVLRLGAVTLGRTLAISVYTGSRPVQREGCDGQYEGRYFFGGASVLDMCALSVVVFLTDFLFALFVAGM